MWHSALLRSYWSEGQFRWYHMMDISPWLKYRGDSVMEPPVYADWLKRDNFMLQLCDMLRYWPVIIEWLFTCMVGTFTPGLNKFHYARLAVLRFWNLDFFPRIKRVSLETSGLRSDTASTPREESYRKVVASSAMMKVNELPSFVLRYPYMQYQEFHSYNNFLTKKNDLVKPYSIFQLHHVLNYICVIFISHMAYISH
jgi:hypothetical protein